MRAVADTSVIVAASLDGGAAQPACAEALTASDAAAAGHAWFESYSVLTRLPGDVRLTPSQAHQVLGSLLSGCRHLSASEQRAFRQWLGASSIAGGAVYDALVGWTARASALPLITRDVRALPIYRSLGIELLIIEPQLA